MGGPMIVLLQQLLEEDYFGWGTTHRWVASISSISGDLNGSTGTYFLGCDETTGLVEKGGAFGYLARAVELLYMGSKHFARPFYPGFRSEDWWPNDGAVSVYSQQYPRIGASHPVGGPLDDGAGFGPGAWYYQQLNDIDHLDIVTFPQIDLVARQWHFYQSLFERLASLDINRPGG
jgi:hypothetical protein